MQYHISPERTWKKIQHNSLMYLIESKNFKLLKKNNVMPHVSITQDKLKIYSTGLG